MGDEKWGMRNEKWEIRNGRSEIRNNKITNIDIVKDTKDKNWWESLNWKFLCGFPLVFTLIASLRTQNENSS